LATTSRCRSSAPLDELVRHYLSTMGDLRQVDTYRLTDLLALSDAVA
jgi:hypothetical protein